MTRKISFTKDERAAIERASELLYDRGKESKSDAAADRALRSLLKKMDEASAPSTAPAPGMGWVRFESIVRQELGDRYAPAQVNIPLTSKRIRDNGVTEEDLVAVCRWIRRQTSPYFAKVAVSRMLVQWAELRAKAMDSPGRKVTNGGGGPLEIGEG